MNLLLDTHTFIWFINGNKELSDKAKRIIENPSNKSYISIATIWEMAIKISLERLKINKPFESILEQILKNNFEILPITFEHTLLISKLSFHHRDPFDRIIIAQGHIEKMTIVTKDENFSKYNIKLLW